MDGFTVTRLIREIQERTGQSMAFIAALTVHAYEEDIRACREAG